MSAFDLDVRGRELLDNEARRNPFTPDKLGPGFFEGIPQSIPMGIMRGGAYAADAMQTFGRFFDPPMSQERRDATDALAQDIRSSSVDYWTPAPGEVGTAGRVLGGLAELPLPLMAAGGNPSLLIGSEVNRVGKDLVDAGVDARTAVAVGVAQGGATAIGFKLPFLGRTLATRVASGTVGNLVTNAGTTAAQRQLLLGGGYDEIAQAYDPLDVEARAVDLLTGVAFGALAHVQMRNADRAAVIAAQNAKHFQQDTAPGTPADTVSNSLHQTALAHSIQQALRGEPVSVPDVSRATFTPRPASPAAAARPEVAEEVLGPVYDVRLTDPIVRDALAGMAEQTGQASDRKSVV